MNQPEFSCELPTPLGRLTICANALGISRIEFMQADSSLHATSAVTQSPRLTVLTSLAPPPALQANVETLSHVYVADALATATQPGAETFAKAHLQQASLQLQQYFAGERQHFSLQLAATGTRFQQQVWQALSAIPFAHSCSYGAIAQALQNPKAVRAVGAANGRNPIAIVVPCHRVIGANGSLTGYAGGLQRKLWLLQHEAKQL